MKNKTPNIEKGTLIQMSRGDESAFDSIYWAYNSYIYNFIYSLLYDKSMAEDLTQTVFLKIWERRKDIDPEQHFEAYVFTIARHLIYKETENRLFSEQFMEVLSTRADCDVSTENLIEAKFVQEYIDTLIENLPPSRREIFKLSRYLHLSNKEIANRLSISEKTVETQIYRSLCYLKQRLSTHEGVGVLLLLLACKC